jgi:DNA-binding response OmpR family regulator
MNMRVLLVEDSPTQSLEYSLHLQQAGYQVDVAANGVEALRYLTTQTPQYIVLDLHLPDMDGIQICRRIRRDSRIQTIPIIMLTAADTGEGAIEGLEAGANDYIPKDAFAAENLLTSLSTLA